MSIPDSPIHYHVYNLAAERRFKGLLSGFEDILNNLDDLETIEDAVNACMENVVGSLEGYACDWAESIEDCDEMPTKGSILGFVRFYQMVTDASEDKHVPTPELDKQQERIEARIREHQLRLAEHEAQIRANRERLRSLSSQVIEAAED